MITINHQCHGQQNQNPQESLLFAQLGLVCQTCSVYITVCISIERFFVCCKCPIEALSFIGKFPQKIISANVILLHSAARYELFNSNLQIYCCWLSSSGKASLHTDKVKDLSDFFNFLKNTLFYTF